MKLLTLLAILLSSSVHGAEHKLFAGLGWTHFSNVDAGPPFNSDYEDGADHYGLNIEYQFVLKSENYFYGSVGVGRTRLNTKYQQGWDCSGCSLPSVVQFGFKWRIL